MSTVTCPNGHESADAEWCDTCGAKIGGPATSPSASAPSGPVVTTTATAAPASSGANVDCPHCDGTNPPDALFCEVCGYDFTTGQAPVADPVATPTATPVPNSTVNWIAVVEVDPEWYALKGALADQPCPPVSSSTLPLANHTALVGRTSSTRNLHPEIALDADTGVSRRHAQFVRAADQLTVVDLSSTNGTYVVPVGEAPHEASQPLVPGVPCELHDGDRVYVGAWSRLTVRSSPATS